MKILSDKQIAALKLGRVKGIKRPTLKGRITGLTPWNKGKKGIHLSPNTEWKKGQTPKGSVIFKKGNIPWNKGLVGFNSGELSPTWKGGKTLHQGKYWLIYTPNHPFSDNKGYVREHRLVVENEIGRYLRVDELVHHRNGNTTDNRIENLEIVNRSDHIKMHKSQLDQAKRSKYL